MRARKQVLGMVAGASVLLQHRTFRTHSQLPLLVPSRWPRPLASTPAAVQRNLVSCQVAATSDAHLADPLQWLEEVKGKRALEWVEDQNKHTVGQLGNPEGTETYRRILAILDSNEKIPYVGKLGNWFYNFWQDENHKKGIWRRTTMDSYRTATPDWQTVLDLDALAAAEETPWVWGGYRALDEGPNSRWDRALVILSPGGSDAKVYREFDLENCRFISAEEGGFVLPAAKSRVGYRTRDEVLVGTDFGEGSLTASGYPRVAKAWRRGTALELASTVFEGKHEDVSADQYMYFDRGHWHEFQHRFLDFYTSAKSYRPGNPEVSASDSSAVPFKPIPVPDDASVGTFSDAAIISVRSTWEVGGRVFKAGLLLSVQLSDCMDGDFSQAQVLFEPTERSSLQSSDGTKNFMVLLILNNVKTELQFWRYTGKGRWTLEAPKGDQTGVPVGCDVGVRPVSPDDSDEIWLIKDGYLQPDLLQLASAADCATSCEDVKSKPAMFDSSNFVVEQSEATSVDGTKVPYFLIRPKNCPFDGTTPTLLDGYGGFEVSLTPGYAAGVGVGWLERGGSKVIANIRGGGEFGPTWHQAALRENRHKAYEDFEAVARDLIKRGLTTPSRLACIGGSNGGLLVGNMLTREGSRLFGAVVCQVPLLDMQRYHKLLAGASWMAEYGDPDKPEEWQFIRTFSPYHRLGDVCLQPGSTWTCPRVLFTTSTMDDRVHPGHARKMVGKLLKDTPATKAPAVLYWENTQGGHGGAADNKQRAYMWTLTYEFLCRTIGGIGDAQAQLSSAPASKL